jgi:CO/xanthine dehydrogenase Mo-binding subunit
MIANALPLSLTDNPLLSQWIAFETPGVVQVGSGKVEIGQGILTALTQIAAEELDVAPEQVKLVSGQTDVSPAEGFTSGSYSIAVGGASIRLVCAEVRSLFLDRAAEALKCPIGELSIENGKILRAGRDTGRDYWSMANEIKLERRATGTAPTKRPSSYRIVGKSLPRLDLPAKVMGAGLTGVPARVSDRPDSRSSRAKRR